MKTDGEDYRIELLGRATKVHLLLVSQRFDYQSIPVSVREQLNVLINLLTLINDIQSLT